MISHPFQGARPYTHDVSRFRRPSEVALLDDMALGQIPGLSAQTLVLCALRLAPPVARPHDAGDWERCVAAFDRLPPHLKRRVWRLYCLWAEPLGYSVGPAPKKKWWMR